MNALKEMEKATILLSMDMLLAKVLVLRFPLAPSSCVPVEAYPLKPVGLELPPRLRLEPLRVAQILLLGPDARIKSKAIIPTLRATGQTST